MRLKVNDDTFDDAFNTLNLNCDSEMINPLKSATFQMMEKLN